MDQNRVSSTSPRHGSASWAAHALVLVSRGGVIWKAVTSTRRDAAVGGQVIQPGAMSWAKHTADLVCAPQVLFEALHRACFRDSLTTVQGIGAGGQVISINLSFHCLISFAPGMWTGSS